MHKHGGLMNAEKLLNETIFILSLSSKDGEDMIKPFSVVVNNALTTDH